MTRGNLIKKKDGNMVGLFSQGNQYKWNNIFKKYLFIFIFTEIMRRIIQYNLKELFWITEQLWNMTSLCYHAIMTKDHLDIPFGDVINL